MGTHDHVLLTTGTYEHYDRATVFVTLPMKELGH